MSFKDMGLEMFEFGAKIIEKVKSLGFEIEEDALESLFVCIYNIRKDDVLGNNILNLELGIRIIEKATRILNVDNLFPPKNKRNRINKKDIIIAFEVMKDYEIADLTKELTEEGLLFIANKIARKSIATGFSIEKSYNIYIKELSGNMNTDFLDFEKETLLLLANEKLNEKGRL